MNVEEMKRFVSKNKVEVALTATVLVFVLILLGSAVPSIGLFIASTLIYGVIGITVFSIVYLVLEAFAG